MKIARYGNTGFPLWIGLASETKSTSLGEGAYAIETDTPGSLWRYLGGSWVHIVSGGDMHVRAKELGIETFSGVVVSPGTTSIPFVTIPAGCYTLLLSPVKASLAAVSGWIALTEAVGIAVNTDAAIGSIAQGQYILQLEDPDLRIGVNPGDQVEFICSATGVGSLIAKYLG